MKVQGVQDQSQKEKNLPLCHPHAMIATFKAPYQKTGTESHMYIFASKLIYSSSHLLFSQYATRFYSVSRSVLFLFFLFLFCCLMLLSGFI